MKVDDQRTEFTPNQECHLFGQEILQEVSLFCRPNEFVKPKRCGQLDCILRPAVDVSRVFQHISRLTHTVEMSERLRSRTGEDK